MAAGLVMAVAIIRIGRNEMGAPRTDEFDIAAFNHIANTVGGDLYDFVQLRRWPCRGAVRRRVRQATLIPKYPRWS